MMSQQASSAWSRNTTGPWRGAPVTERNSSSKRRELRSHVHLLPWWCDVTRDRVIPSALSDIKTRPLIDEDRFLMLNFGEPENPTLEEVIPFLERIFARNAS